MSNVANEWKGIGRFTRDMELKTIANEKNTAVLRNTIAIDNGKDKNGNELPADFIPVTAFGKSAETIAKYCKKGDLIAIAGAIKTDSYDDKNGNKVYTWAVVVDGYKFLQPKNNNNNSNGNTAPAQQRQQTAQSAPSNVYPEADTSFADLDGIEDELPDGWGN